MKSKKYMITLTISKRNNKLIQCNIKHATKYLFWVFAGGCKFLLEVAGSCWRLQVLAGGCRFLPNVAGSCWRLQVLAERCRFLLEVAGSCWRLQVHAGGCNTASSCWKFQVLAGGCRFLLGVAGSCWRLQVLAGGCNTASSVFTVASSMQCDIFLVLFVTLFIFTLNFCRVYLNLSVSSFLQRAGCLWWQMIMINTIQHFIPHRYSI